MRESGENLGLRLSDDCCSHQLRTKLAKTVSNYFGWCSILETLLSATFCIWKEKKELNYFIVLKHFEVLIFVLFSGVHTELKIELVWQACANLIPPSQVTCTLLYCFGTAHQDVFSFLYLYLYSSPWNTNHSNQLCNNWLYVHCT